MILTRAWLGLGLSPGQGVDMFPTPCVSVNDGYLLGALTRMVIRFGKHPPKVSRASPRHCGGGGYNNISK